MMFKRLREWFGAKVRAWLYDWAQEIRARAREDAEKMIDARYARNLTILQGEMAGLARAAFLESPPAASVDALKKMQSKVHTESESLRALFDSVRERVADLERRATAEEHDRKAALRPVAEDVARLLKTADDRPRIDKEFRFRLEGMDRALNAVMRHQATPAPAPKAKAPRLVCTRAEAYRLTGRRTRIGDDVLGASGIRYRVVSVEEAGRARSKGG